MKGYMTVEASMILPLVFGVVMFVLSLLFYSYDRCLLEQDVAALVVRSEYLDGGTIEEKAQRMNAEIAQWYWDKYVWMDVRAPKLVVREDSVQIRIEGDFQGPFFEAVAVERQGQTWSPTFWLRQKIKLDRAKENEEAVNEHGVY